MKGDKVTSVFGILFALFILKESVALDIGGLHQPGPGFFSLFGGCMLFLFSTILLLRSLMGKGDGTGKKKGKEEENPKAVVYTVLALIFYGLALEYLGFVVCTFFMVMLLTFLFDRRKWWTVLFTSFSVALGSYVVFNVLLKSDLPMGILDRFF